MRPVYRKPIAPIVGVSRADAPWRAVVRATRGGAYKCASWVQAKTSTVHIQANLLI